MYITEQQPQICVICRDLNDSLFVSVLYTSTEHKILNINFFNKQNEVAKNLHLFINLYKNLQA